MGVDDRMAREQPLNESNILLRSSVAHLIKSVVNTIDFVTRLPKDSWKVALTRARRIFEEIALHERRPRSIRIEIRLPVEGIPFEELNGSLASRDLSQVHVITFRHSVVRLRTAIKFY